MNNWKTTTIEKLLEKNTGVIRGMNQKFFQEKGQYPIVDQSQSLICGYTDDKDRLYSGNLPVIVFGDHTRVFKYVDFPFAPGADGTKILNTGNNLNPKFFYYSLLNLDFPSRGYNRHYKFLKEQIIKYPEVKTIQNKIVTILDKIQKAINTQDKIIEKTKELKKATMKKLFTEGTRGETLKETEIGMMPKSWGVYKLGELCNFVNGKTPLRTNREYWENGSVPWFTIDDIRTQGRIITSTNQHISELGLKEAALKIVPKNTLLLCCTASIGEYAQTKIELTTNQQFNALVPKNKNLISTDYLFAYAPLLKNKLENLMGTTTFGFVSLSQLGTISIKVPTLDEQIKISNIFLNIDDQINIEQKKKEKYQELFKSTLKKLMNREVEVDNLKI